MVGVQKSFVCVDFSFPCTFLSIDLIFVDYLGIRSRNIYKERLKIEQSDRFGINGHKTQKRLYELNQSEKIVKMNCECLKSLRNI